MQSDVMSCNLLSSAAAYSSSMGTPQHPVRIGCCPSCFYSGIQLSTSHCCGIIETLPVTNMRGRIYLMMRLYISSCDMHNSQWSAVCKRLSGVHCNLQYHNIFSLVRELGIPWPFTDWTTSGFWSPEGLTTSAPVFSQQQQYPTMLGQFIHTMPLFR